MTSLPGATSTLRKTYDTEVASRRSQASRQAVAAIPTTSRERLDRAHPKLHHHPTDCHTVLPSSAAGTPITSPDVGQSTVLYLAYGSNLCAQTFEGVRGIKPLSQINVTAPSLTLTFDLPGLPYREPCFANTAPRLNKKPPGKLPGKPPFDPPPGIPGEPPVPVPTLPPALIGVVYEVTPEDYAKIVATEGGGSSYTQIVVPCLPLPPSVTIPEKPPVPEPPKPFLARTLCMPRIPDTPGDDTSLKGKLTSGRGDHDDKKKKKWKWLLPPQRPDPSYAQPSLRYLNLIRTGAAEHDLPQSYRDYLNSLQPYSITSFRQKVGRFLLTSLWAPLMILFFGLSRYVADKNGRVPAWLAACMTVMFNAIWASYDLVFKKLFGDGERTEKNDDDDDDDDDGDDGDGDATVSKIDKRRRRKSSITKRLRKLSGTTRILDEEKKALGSESSDGD